MRPYHHEQHCLLTEELVQSLSALLKYVVFREGTSMNPHPFAVWQVVLHFPWFVP